MKKVTTVTTEYEEGDIVRIHKETYGGRFSGAIASVINATNHENSRYLVRILKDKDIGNIGNETTFVTSEFTYLTNQKKYTPAFAYEFSGLDEDMDFYPDARVIVVGCKRIPYKDAIEIAETILEECKPKKRK